MTGKTHTIIGVVSGIYVSQHMCLDTGSMIVFTLTTALASTLPDIDQKIGLTHRGLTHSLIPLAGLYMLYQGGFYPLMIQAILLGYGLHLLADMLTIKGIQLLYPLPKRFRFLPKFLSISTGTLSEYLFVAIVLFYGVSQLLTN